MILYASSTRGRRNLHEMQVHGWRLLFSSAAPDLYRPGWRYALDNGAWSAFASGAPWDEVSFRATVEQHGAGADWVIAPDVVAGGRPSLRLSERWLPWVADRARRVLIAVQDGMEPGDVAPLLGPSVGIAIGGSTEWKEAALGRGAWLALARERGAWMHALRVNTVRRIHLCAGADSLDGSSPTRFATTTPMLTAASRQMVML